MNKLDDAYNHVQGFRKESLRQRISSLEDSLEGKDKRTSALLFADQMIDPTLLYSALVLKHASRQIDEIVHALGIMLALPYVLLEDEQIHSISLAAGNTGRPFDLETNLRIAEFKFIDWKGGPEAIRQNQFFKDFYLLAEHETIKEKYLYCIRAGVPLKFMQGNRALRSVMSRDNKLWATFQQKYGTQFTKVNEYYTYRKANIKVIDLMSIVPFFTPEISEE